VRRTGNTEEVNYIDGESGLSATTMEAPRERSRNYGWVVMGAFMAIDSAFTGIMFSLGLMLPLMTTDLDMSLQQSGWLGSANWMAIAILCIPLASWLARYNPRKVITLAALCSVPFVFIQGWAPNYWVLLISRIAFVAIGLARFPARPLLIQQWFPLEKIARVNSVLTIGMGAVGGSAVFFMGDLIGALNGWRNTFYLFGGIQVVILFVWMILARQGPAPVSATAPEVISAGRERPPIMAIFKYKTLWLLGIAVTGPFLCWGAMFTLWPQYVVTEKILSVSSASYALGLCLYGVMVGSLLCSFISERLGRRKLLLWGPGLLLPVATFGTLFSESFLMIAVFWALWGLLVIYFPIALTIPYEIPGIKPQEVAVATAFVMSVYMGGAALGPIMAGYIADASGSLRFALGVTCVFPFLLFIAGLLIPETGPRARTKAGRSTSA